MHCVKSVSLGMEASTYQFFIVVAERELHLAEWVLAVFTRASCTGFGIGGSKLPSEEARRHMRPFALQMCAACVHGL